VLGRDARRVGRFLIYTAGDRWLAGKPIGNAEVRRVLGKDPRGESEKDLQSLHRFFSEQFIQTAQPWLIGFLGMKIDSY
jgi:hypothetical protein